MKNIITVLGLAGAISCGAPATYAQEPATSPATTAPSSTPQAAEAPAVAAPAQGAKPADNGKPVLREGTDVDLKFAQDLSSKTAADGDPVTFELAEDLKVGDMIVAKAGCKAFGEVTNAKKSGMMGKAGELNIRLDYLKTGDFRVRLRGSKGKQGEDKTGTTVALTVLFGPIGLIKHGKNIDIKQGTPLKVFVAEDIALPGAS